MRYLITMKSARWVLSSATGLISLLLTKYDDTSDINLKGLLGQTINIMRVMSSFIASEQLSYINDVLETDIEMGMQPDIDMLSDIATLHKHFEDS